jgi:hypothetical protein
MSSVESFNIQVSIDLEKKGCLNLPPSAAKGESAFGWGSDGLCGKLWVADLISSLLRRRLRIQKNMSKARRIMRASPPITPPIIAPIGAPLAPFDELEEFVGRASAGGST